MRNIDRKNKPRRAVCWKAFCALGLAICLLPMSSFAQIGGSAPFIKYAQRQARKVPDYGSDWAVELWSFSDAMEFLERYKGIEAGSILPIRISTWTVPVTLVRLEKDGFGNFFIAPTISLGIGYVWINGASLIDAKSESIRIQPQSTIGIAASFGGVNGATGLEGSFTVSGVIGLNSMSMSLGYDILTETAVLGVGFHVNIFGLSSNKYRISRFTNR